MTIVVDSDAHGVETLALVEYGIATARRGWLTAENIANTRPWPDSRRCASARGQAPANRGARAGAARPRCGRPSPLPWREGRRRARGVVRRRLVERSAQRVASSSVTSRASSIPPSGSATYGPGASVVASMHRPPAPRAARSRSPRAAGGDEHARAAQQRAVLVRLQATDIAHALGDDRRHAAPPRPAPRPRGAPAPKPPAPVEPLLLGVRRVGVAAMSRSPSIGPEGSTGTGTTNPPPGAAPGLRPGRPRSRARAASPRATAGAPAGAATPRGARGGSRRRPRRSGSLPGVAKQGGGRRGVDDRPGSCSRSAASAARRAASAQPEIDQRHRPHFAAVRRGGNDHAPRPRARATPPARVRRRAQPPPWTRAKRADVELGHRYSVSASTRGHQRVPQRVDVTLLGADVATETLSATPTPGSTVCDRYRSPLALTRSSTAMFSASRSVPAGP